MKKLSFWTRANVMPLFGLLITIAVLMTWTSESWAFGDYDQGCDTCHGDFRDSPYTSLSDGSNWGDDLHDVHRNTMLGGEDCDVCHAGDFSPVSLDSSTGGSGLSAISCVGCHGREEDMGNDSVSVGRGAGLRQHHTNAGESNCTNCHTDAVPANYTPVGEDVLPNYYANPGTGHPAMPVDSCNASGTESFAGALGLDNDGNGDYDTADSSCVVVVLTYAVGGTVSGLTGTGLALQNNGADTLPVAADGPFTFATELVDGSAYAVTVSSQPTGQNCTVTNDSGTIATADVTDVTVTCVTVITYSVGGNVSGLTGTGLALQNNGADTLPVAADGPFTFATELVEGSAYAVTVSSQPTGQNCTVTNGSGTIATADVTDVTVTCVIVPTYPVGGTVTGLTGTGLALQLNGGDTLSIAADGSFTFPTEIAEGSTYVITVSSYPTGQTCTVTNGSGTVGMAEVIDVVVTCEEGIPPSLDSGTPIPTMSVWALILLSMLLGLMAFLNRRRLF